MAKRWKRRDAKLKDLTSREYDSQLQLFWITVPLDYHSNGTFCIYGEDNTWII